MGFLDKAIRRGLGQAIETAVTDKVLNAFAPNAAKNIQRNTETLQQVASTLSSACCPSCGAPLAAGARFCSGCGAHMEPRQAAAYTENAAYATPMQDVRRTLPEILQTDFADYSVQQNVPAASLGSALFPAKPYDYALIRNGRIAAVIMLTDHNRDRNAAFLNAKAAAEQARVPFVNFYTHMANERSYVSGRIRSFL